MKKFALAISAFAFAMAACGSLKAVYLTRDITSEIPEINERGYLQIEDVAQYKNADWSSVIGIAKGVSLEEAYDIADANPNIRFFFHMKGYQMTLEKEDGSYRTFRQGDAVFFAGEPWWGSAPGYSDGYVKLRR